ncbi:hypothetical protein E3N88_22284 [Mikania micrantha]|uniref:Uncharacterized protein n=1 Tax=Mikania micrantha TaxID=192012 RepID=A0A5N6NBI1_9ASTR|nr:hypothetical protein E3N88_22284 [Mikania micrantha]
MISKRKSLCTEYPSPPSHLRPIEKEKPRQHLDRKGTVPVDRLERYLISAVAPPTYRPARIMVDPDPPR